MPTGYIWYRFFGRLRLLWLVCDNLSPGRSHEQALWTWIQSSRRAYSISYPGFYFLWCKWQLFWCEPIVGDLRQKIECLITKERQSTGCEQFLALKQGKVIYYLFRCLGRLKAVLPTGVKQALPYNAGISQDICFSSYVDHNILRALTTLLISLGWGLDISFKIWHGHCLKAISISFAVSGYPFILPSVIKQKTSGCLGFPPRSIGMYL